jgi:hypothetical protein
MYIQSLIKGDFSVAFGVADIVKSAWEKDVSPGEET